MPVENDRFLAAMADTGRRELERHRSQRREWCYHDILGREALADLASRPPVDLDEPTATAFLGNLVVEKGHAEYDRMVSLTLDGHPVFREWKNLWIAEEEPHGAALLEWAKVRGLLDPRRAHQAIQQFLRNGLSLACRNAAAMLAYGALQEAATRLTHKRVKDRLPGDEGHGRRLMSHIVADEERHERFYANVVRAGLQSGDRGICSLQMQAVASVVLGFEMPGIERDITDRESIIRAYRKSAVFTAELLVKDILLPALDGPGRYGWDVAAVGPLDGPADRARDLLVDFVDAARQQADGELACLALMARSRRAVGILEEERTT